MTCCPPIASPDRGDSSGTTRGRGRRRTARLALAAAALAAVAGVAACGSGGSSAADPTVSPSAASTGPFCQQLVIPAFFYSASVWAQAADSQPPAQ